MAVWKQLFDNPADAFKIVSSYVLGAIALLFCIWTAWSQGSSPYIQVLLCILGGVIGWILGLYVTPSSESEKKNFSDYGKALTALASGFGLAKLDEVLQWFKSSSELSGEFAFLRVLLFTCSVLIAALFTYISRLHVRGSEDELRPKREKVYGEIAEAIEKLKRIN